MPSAAWNVAVWTAITAILAYFFVFVQRPLVGVLLAAAFYALAWILAEYSASAGLTPAFSTGRAVVTAVVVVLVLAYALLVAGQILLGLLAAATVLAVAWLTSPTGPLAKPR
ncbi:hypothetical protein [Halegenticoccus tardaugens]|uniref:hypothetical protein n=1 Tax=Halegenticoccus tardaugens TaxID=2071624 RepID=UPI00100A5B0E|nr:hypothetical protein [Halegenticoccus tardaugens]